METELKWRVPFDQAPRLAARLRRLLGPGMALMQANAFHDSGDRRLRRAGMACRLRREAARAWLTCKARLPARHGATRHIEHEWPLSLAEADGLGRDPEALRQRLPEAWCAALDGAPLVRIGGFGNQRRQWRAPDGVLVCLDRTRFTGRIDIELELECRDATAAATARRWRDLLRAWGIPWRPQRLTKFARALG